MKINMDDYSYILPKFIISSIRKIRSHYQLRKWIANGKPVPAPHIVKQLAIKEYQQKYNYEVLVETGTFLGEMVEIQKKNFKYVFSVELGLELYKKAVKRFDSDLNVKIFFGDSGKVLPSILLQVNQPSIFWLDGHYSGEITAKGEKECPIFEELEAIFANKSNNHILLIDDARCFVGDGDYPTIEELTKVIKGHNNQYKVEVKDDIIRAFI